MSADKKGSPHLEWRTCESDAEWQTQFSNTSTLAARPSGAVQRPNWLLRHWRAGGVLLIAIVAFGIWLWSVAQSGLAQIEAEVRESVEADLWKTLADNQESDHSSIMGALPLDLPRTGTVQLLTLTEETAIVRVVIQPGPNQPLLRQTRIYQRTELGWQRIAPIPALWGSPRRLQTEYFDFHYYAQDDKAVAGAAALMDTLYYSIATTLHLSVPAGAKITIEIDPTQIPGSIARRPNPAAALVVASPATYLAPLTVSESDLLVQSLVLGLLNNQQRQIALPHWRSLLNGLYLWQLWAVELPLASMQEPLTRRIMAELEDPQAESFLDEPAFNTELCALYQLWMQSPMEIEIPVPCGNPSWEKGYWAVVKSSYRPPLTLAQLAPVVASPLGLHPTHPAHPGYAVALATLVEYAVDTYGRPRLSLLVASLDQHQSWETLAPAVFGLSASDFERGWQSYLVEKYDVSLTQ